jgi:hypothetical protein
MPPGSAEQLRAADLQRWRAEFPDATPIDSVRVRHRGMIVGVVIRVRLNPGRGIDVTVEDGSGRITAMWTGRTRLPGVRLGAGLRLVGTVAQEPDGSLRMRNPEYDLVADPYR